MPVRYSGSGWVGCREGEMKRGDGIESTVIWSLVGYMIDQRAASMGFAHGNKLSVK